VPQLTAVMEAARAAKGTGVPSLPMRHQVFRRHYKSIAAGAACVMIGSLFAGTEESPGETILYQAGLSSRIAHGLDGRHGCGFGPVCHGSGTGDGGNPYPKVEGRVPYKGPLSADRSTRWRIEKRHGVRGAATLHQLSERAASCASRPRACARATSTT